MAAERFKGGCHCGEVRFEAKIDLATARRCNCSLCSMRGAVAVSTKLTDLTILKGANALNLYTFNTGKAKHYFCRHCGIYTHHQRRSNPQEFGVNAACLDGVSPFDFTEVVVMDGIAHPTDKGMSRVAGALHFSKAPDQRD